MYKERAVDGVALSKEGRLKGRLGDYEGQRLCHEQALELGIATDADLLARIYRYNLHKGGYNFVRAAQLYILHGKSDWTLFAGLGPNFEYGNETEELLTLMMYRVWTDDMRDEINELDGTDDQKMIDLLRALHLLQEEISGYGEYALPQ